MKTPQSFAHRLRLRISGGRPGLSGGVHGVLCDPLMDRRLMIGKPLAFDALKQHGGAFLVFDAERGSARISEIELGKIAAKMSFAD